MTNIVELDYSGHYPSKFIAVSDKELETIKKLTANKYLSDTPEGRQVMAVLENVPEIDLGIKLTVVMYI